VSVNKSIKVKYKSPAKKINKAWERAARLKLRVLGAMLKAGIQEKLTGQEGRTGYDYWIPELGVWYTASAPGEWPSERLGDLKKSIKFQVGSLLGSPFLVIGTDIEYAAKLENNGRPFITRYLRENEDFIKDFLK